MDSDRLETQNNCLTSFNRLSTNFNWLTRVSGLPSIF